MEAIVVDMTVKQIDGNKLFLYDLCRLFSLPRSTADVLSSLMDICNKENEIILNPYIKNKITKTLEIKNTSLVNAISKLTKADLINRIDRDTYIPNSKYFGIVENWRDYRVTDATWVYSTRGRELKNLELVER